MLCRPLGVRPAVWLLPRKPPPQTHVPGWPQGPRRPRSIMARPPPDPTEQRPGLRGRRAPRRAPPLSHPSSSPTPDTLPWRSPTHCPLPHCQLDPPSLKPSPADAPAGPSPIPRGPGGLSLGCAPAPRPAHCAARSRSVLGSNAPERSRQPRRVGVPRGPRSAAVGGLSEQAGVGCA